MNRSIAKLLMLLPVPLLAGCPSIPARVADFGACWSNFQFVDKDGTHWEVGQNIQIAGPVPPESQLFPNKLIVAVSSGHPTLPDVYVGNKTAANEFDLLPIVKSGLHGEEKPHPQKVLLRLDEDNCPFFAKFEDNSGGDHNHGGSDEDHGGHAGAARY